MSQTDQTTGPLAPATLGPEDIRQALGAGLTDFTRAPVYGMIFGAVFSAVGVAIAWLLVVQGSSYWVLPLAAGFPLIGPFAATGLYEISRRLEAGEPLSWPAILGAVRRGGRSQIASYAFVVLFIYLIWVYLAHLIFALSFGLKPLTNVMSSSGLLLSVEGFAMLTVGTAVGGAIAALMFSISVITVPMLLERDIDIVSAMILSVRTVIANTGTMLVWGAVLVALIVMAMLPLFLGMIVIFPVLGHASWHIYRRAVGQG